MNPGRKEQRAKNIIANLGSPNTHWGVTVELTSLPTYPPLKSDGKLSSAENILKSLIQDPLKLKNQYYIVENKLHGFSLILALKKKSNLGFAKFLQINMKKA